MRLDVTSNLGQVVTESKRLHPQFQFACAKALTDTVRLVRAAMPAHLERTLNRPTQFTKAGFFIQPARKDALSAVVGVKDRQAQYLAY